MSSSMMHSQSRMRQTSAHPMVATDVVILAGVVGFIITFFSWYSISSSSFSTTISGWHGWGIPAGILFGIGALLAIGRTMGMSLGTKATDSAVLALLGIAAIICTIIFMATEGSGYGAGYSTGPMWGAWVGLACGIVMTLAALAIARE